MSPSRAVVREEGVVSEHVYTHAGWQRAVRVPDDCTDVGFVVVGADEAKVAVTYDPWPRVAAGKAAWQDWPSGCGGVASGVSALRVHLACVDGWATLHVRCLGALRQGKQMA